MFLDASALTAMLGDEEDARVLLTRMQAHAERRTSPLAVWEASVALARILAIPPAEALGVVEEFLSLTGVSIDPVPAEAHRLALQAWATYGKGRHPAALNFGDCFAYACARLAGEPLLYKGDDFPRTDIAPA
ncbi:type II toxin-antitoxin system VapC family toxin [Marinibacterium profundimaris]|uniref:Ribonuclease VapC n=1 Tax=Marinibacterium profundimaris TaxID=1679460 RepID=A0A225NEM8_9RHOB|nr:type II toxin-antitoxin system VapC family toxin [Marinibacterium profundimaris]OWU71004.1 twitching motility protein PilT [Marinibacterium profundimaris]